MWKKRTSKSSELWNFFHQICMNDHQQPFVSCNKCKTLLLYSSLNGTNSLGTPFQSCAKTNQSDLYCQKTIHDFYFSKQSSIPKRIKLSFTEACTEFCALDGCAFDVITGDGFQNLAKILFDAGQTINKPRIEVKHLLPHPTILRTKNTSINRVWWSIMSLQISRNITRLYGRYKNQLIGLCEQLASFCLIVDQWSEAHTD